MNKFTGIATVGALLAAATTAQAQPAPVGHVIATTPIVQQVAVPRQVCAPQQVATATPNTGVGAAVGAIAGGLLGSTARGPGQGAATVAGVLGGALVGNAVEGTRTQVTTVQNCSTQTVYENQTVAYDVTYEYAGQRYHAQLDHDPGPTIALQVLPAGTTAQSVAPAVTYTDATAVPPPPPAYYYDYGTPYYAPAVLPSVSLSIGGGWYGGGPHRGGWR